MADNYPYAQILARIAFTELDRDPFVNRILEEQFFSQA